VRWWTGFEDMVALVAGRFAQVESRRRGQNVLVLLSGAERKNFWTIAEQAGDRDPGRVVADRLRESRCYSVAPLQWPAECRDAFRCLATTDDDGRKVMPAGCVTAP
jgi:hypothetical protein